VVWARISRRGTASIIELRVVCACWGEQVSPGGGEIKGQGQIATTTTNNTPTYSISHKRNHVGVRSQQGQHHRIGCLVRKGNKKYRHRFALNVKNGADLRGYLSRVIYEISRAIRRVY
jgi:hypothetical protein